MDTGDEERDDQHGEGRVVDDLGRLRPAAADAAVK
jgi:hypothetical protein